MAKSFSELLESHNIKTSMVVGKTIAQYGVKGMRWGIRNDRNRSVDLVSPKSGARTSVTYNPKKVTVNPVTRTASGASKREVKKVQDELDRAGLKLKRLDDMSTDFKKAYMARTKHPSELSNDEMRDLVNRMNLEQQYAQVMARQISLVPKPPPSKIAQGTKFATSLLKDIAKDEVKRVARGVVKQTVNKEAKKRGLDLEGKKDKKKNN